MPGRRPLVVLGAIYLAAVGAYLLLASRQALPLIAPDEFTYGHLARSLADGQGLTWRGEPIALRSALYVYAIAPAWLVTDSTTTAYAIARGAGAVLACLAAFPAWLLARRFVGPQVGVIPAALVLCGSWMLTVAGLLTENLGFPLATATLASTAMVLADRRARWGWFALAFALLASWARLQLVVLVPIIFLSVVLHAASSGHATRRVLGERSALLAVTGGLSLAGLVIALARPSTLGSYGGITGFRPTFEDLASAVGHQALALTVMSGILPVILVAAASSQRGAWRNPAIGPLLCVTWCGSIVFILESAWMVTGFGSFHIERYVQYTIPVLFVAATVCVSEGVDPRRMRAATLVLAALLVLTPPLRNVIEEPATYGIVVPAHALLGMTAGQGLAVLTLAIGLAAAALMSGRISRGRGAAALVGLLLCVLVVQDVEAWRLHWRISRAWTVTFPRDRDWIDAATPSPVTRLVVTGDASHWEGTEFFNRRVDRVFQPAGAPAHRIRGATCPWAIDRAGVVAFGEGCGRPGRQFLIDDDFGRLTFYDQRIVADTRHAGRLVAVPGRPRVLGVVQKPCSEPAPRTTPTRAGANVRNTVRCLPGMAAQFWLDAPGMLVLRFHGGVRDESVTVMPGGRRILLPHGRAGTVRIPVARGASGSTLALSWRGPSPRLVRADLVQGARRTPLL